jgi:hypothetical protein
MLQKPPRSIFLVAALIGVVLVLMACPSSSSAAPIIVSGLDASLDTGSLAGTHFPVSFSYDAALVSPTGQSFVPVESFDFTLLGVAFHRSDIFQGGQVILDDQVVQNVTASFQVVLPPSSPVQNITFGFGGPGVIGYIDNASNPGTGSFTIVPEPSALLLLAAFAPAFLGRKRWAQKR